MRPESELNFVSADLSIVIPVFNEEGNVLPLAREIVDAMHGQKLSYEIVFVDDASTDSTWVRIGEAAQSIPQVRGLRHVKNSGQSAALWTGIAATQSPILATLDGDLQNDPADLPGLIACLDRADFVCGVRTKRQDNFVRKVSSRVARVARRAVLRVDFADTGCAFRVFQRTVLDGVFSFNGLHRFLPILVHGGGHSTLEVPINHRPRISGVSKYGVWNRLGRGVFDLAAMAWYQRRRLGAVRYLELKADLVKRESGM